MKLFGLSITRTSRLASSKRSADGSNENLPPAALAWLRGDNSVPTGPLLSSAYEQVVWVYRAINALAEQVANIPFLLSQGERGRENLITSGPLHDFYNRPHPSINRFQYWELRVLWLMLRGECMRIPIYEDASRRLSPSPSHGEGAAGRGASQPTRSVFSLSSSGGEGRGEEAVGHPASSSLSTINHQLSTNSALKSVLILDPSRFQHIIQNNQLVGWRYKALGHNAPLESQVFLPEEVWFEKLPNPFDFWRGLPPLQVADLAAKTDFAAASLMRGAMESNGDNGLIVRTANPLDEQQREQILAEIRNRRRQAGSPHRPLLLWSSAEVIQPQLSSADLQFLDNRKFSRAEICAAFGVPEEIITSTDHNKYDVMQGARLNFIENRVAPLCARLEAEENSTTLPALLSPSINHQLSTINSSVTGWFDLDSLPIMEQARRNRLATAKLGFDMGIPLNELNRLLDLGITPLPWGNTGYLPATLRELGTHTLPIPNSQAKAAPPAINSSASAPGPAEKLQTSSEKASPPPQPPDSYTSHTPPPPAPDTTQLLHAVRELRDVICS